MRLLHMNTFVEFLILAPTILFGLSFHEFAHGWVAFRLGDPTARDQGRLSLNPIRHLDLLGTISMFIFKLGWAKPVPVNPQYFKNPRQDLMLVSIAGPAANLILALIGSVLMRGLFLIPSLPFANWVGIVLVYFVWLNFILAFFNLIPIPPLDGSKVLLGLIPDQAARIIYPYFRYGPLLLIGLIFFGDRIGLDLFGSTVLPISRWCVRLFVDIDF